MRDGSTWPIDQIGPMDVACQPDVPVGRTRVNLSGPSCGLSSTVDGIQVPALPNVETGRLRVVGARLRTQDIAVLAAGAAHDLNNFLQVIGHSLELLARGTAQDPASNSLSGVAQQALRRAVELSRQLTTSAHDQQLRMETLRLDDLPARMGDILLRALPPAVRLDMRHGAALWRCTTDIRLLEAAILNLAINARDAMPDGGTLTIGLDNVVVGHADVARAGLPAGAFVVVSVSDTGKGMDRAVLERVFEPFFTTKDGDRGTGLGLSQVQRFAERCDGYVAIDSVPGRGTRVSVYLPRSEEPS